MDVRKTGAVGRHRSVMRGAAALLSAGAGDDGDATHRIVLEHAACENAPLGSNASDPRRREYYQRGPVVVASAPILLWLLDRMIAASNWNAAMLVDSTARIARLGALRGLTFEALALAVLRGGGKFRIRRLRGTDVPKACDVGDCAEKKPEASPVKKACLQTSKSSSTAIISELESSTPAVASASKKLSLAMKPVQRRDAAALRRLRSSSATAVMHAARPALCAPITSDVDDALLDVPVQELHAWHQTSDLIRRGSFPAMLVPSNSNEAGLDALLWLSATAHHVPIDCTVSSSHGLH
jgi:hypothetical protein